jgi:hypothetical protein
VLQILNSQDARQPRTPGLDIEASAKRGADDKASRADAKAVVDRWPCASAALSLEFVAAVRRG